MTAASTAMRISGRIGCAVAGFMLVCGLIGLATPAHADDRSGAPSPIGYWALAGKAGVVQIYTCGIDTLCGALVGIEFDHPTDPMPTTWDHHPQCGFPFIGNLKRRSAKPSWFGTITNPKSGKTYNARVKLASPGVLKLRGYLLLPAFGETETWTRYPGIPPADCRMSPADFGG